MQLVTFILIQVTGGPTLEIQELGLNISSTTEEMNVWCLYCTSEMRRSVLVWLVL